MAFCWRGSRDTESHLFLSTLQLAVHLPDRSRQYPASSEARRVSAGCATRARVTRTSTCCEEKLTMAVPFCRFAGQRASLAATGFLGGFFGGRPPGIYPIALPAARDRVNESEIQRDRALAEKQLMIAMCTRRRRRRSSTEGRTRRCEHAGGGPRVE